MSLASLGLYIGIASAIYVFFFLFIKKKKTIKISTETVTIEAANEVVFKVLTHAIFIEKISPSVSQISLDGKDVFGEGDKYKRTFYSHNIPNRQTVEFKKIIDHSQLITHASLLGYKVVYTHSLRNISENQTQLIVEKSIIGKGIQHLLITHLLTEPEHEGQYINLVKLEAEKLVG